MMSTNDETPEAERERLTHRADLVRARMLRRIDLLEARRHELGRAFRALPAQAKRKLPLIAGVTAVAALAAVVLVRMNRARQQRHQPWALTTRPGSEVGKSGALARSLRALALALGPALVQKLGERALQRWP